MSSWNHGRKQKLSSIWKSVSFDTWSAWATNTSLISLIFASKSSRRCEKVADKDFFMSWLEIFTSPHNASLMIAWRHCTLVLLPLTASPMQSHHCWPNLSCAILDCFQKRVASCAQQTTQASKTQPVNDISCMYIECFQACPTKGSQQRQETFWRAHHGPDKTHQFAGGNYPLFLLHSSLRICRAPSSSPPAAYFSWPLTGCLPMCMQPLMIHSRPSGSSWQSATPFPYLAMIANQTIANINKIKPDLLQIHCQQIKKTNPSLFTYEDHSGPPVVRRWLQTGWAHPMLETCPALPSGGMSNSCLCCMQTVKFFEIGFSDQLYTRFQNKHVNI